MGAAFIIEGFSDLNASVRLHDWTSSTCAELAAIFLALITAPISFSVKIYSDSLDAIQLVQNFLSNQSTRAWLKSMNTLWTMRIVTLVREKHLNLELIKIKSHSSIELNEQVDQLAKEGSETGYDISTFFTCNSNHVRYFFHFKNIPIEHRFRRFVFSVFQVKAEAEWALLHNMEERFTNHSIW